MAPRNRTSKNKDLENIPNLYRETKGGTDYYLYRNPANRKSVSLGKNKNVAIRKALELNEHFGKDKSLIELLSDSYGFDELVSRYKKEILPDRGLAKSTLKVVIARLDKIGADLSQRDTKTFTVEDCASYLNNNFENYGYVKHRVELIQLFQFAMTIGWADSNPAEATYAKTSIEKVTKRMTIDQFVAIYAVSPPFVRVAMLMALALLQGRAEVLLAKYTHVEGEAIKFTRQKTQKYDRANILVSSPLVPEIVALSRDSIASPFIVHRKPARVVSKRNASHWSQVLPNHFTSVFRKLRDESEAFKGVPEAQRSGFHEIRALGSYLFDQQGVELKSVQAVMAHGDGKMTEYYQSGHNSEIQYVDAPIPALDLAGLGIKI